MRHQNGNLIKREDDSYNNVIHITSSETLCIPMEIHSHCVLYCLFSNELNGINKYI